MIYNVYLADIDNIKIIDILNCEDKSKDYVNFVVKNKYRISYRYKLKIKNCYTINDIKLFIVLFDTIDISDKKILINYFSNIIDNIDDFKFSVLIQKYLMNMIITFGNELTFDVISKVFNKFLCLNIIYEKLTLIEKYFCYINKDKLLEIIKHNKDDFQLIMKAG